MNERINQAELARRLNVTRGAVSKAVKSGRIAPGEDGLFNLAEAEAQWAANSRPNMRASESPAAKGKASGYAASRARREHAQALMAELKLGIARGQYLERAEVDRALDDVVGFARSGLENLPTRVAGSLLGLDHAGIVARPRSEINALMEEMHRDAVRQLKALEEAGALSRVDIHEA